jgi:hypothetical protein
MSRTRMVLLAAVLAGGSALFTSSGVSAAPIGGSMIYDHATLADPLVLKIHERWESGGGHWRWGSRGDHWRWGSGGGHWRWGSGGGGHWRWGSGGGHWRWGSGGNRCHNRWNSHHHWCNGW